MDAQQAIDLGREALWVSLLVGAPVLVAGMVVGLVICLLQAVTQIQEQTVAFVPKLVARALPGMAMRHLPVPPPAVNARVDFQYFGIDKAGPCWEHIMQTKRVGVYVPGELPDPDLELMVILES